MDTNITNSQDEWESEIESRTLAYELNAKTSYATFVDLLNQLAEDVPDDVLETLFCAVQAQDYTLMGTALADCITASCRHTAIQWIPKPL